MYKVVIHYIFICQCNTRIHGIRYTVPWYTVCVSYSSYFMTFCTVLYILYIFYRFNLPYQKKQTKVLINNGLKKSTKHTEISLIVSLISLTHGKWVIRTILFLWITSPVNQSNISLWITLKTWHWFSIHRFTL